MKYLNTALYLGLLIIGLVIGLSAVISAEAPAQTYSVELRQSIVDGNVESESNDSFNKTIYQNMANLIVRQVNLSVENEPKVDNVADVDNDIGAIARQKIPSKRDDDSFLSQNTLDIEYNNISYANKYLDNGTKVITMIDPELVSNARHGGLLKH